MESIGNLQSMVLERQGQGEHLVTLRRVDFLYIHLTVLISLCSTASYWPATPSHSWSKTRWPPCLLSNRDEIIAKKSSSKADDRMHSAQSSRSRNLDQGGKDTVPRSIRSKSPLKSIASISQLDHRWFRHHHKHGFFLSTSIDVVSLSLSFISLLFHCTYKV